MSNSTPPVVPYFDTVDNLHEALQNKGKGTDIDLYPRDGSRDLYYAEQQIGLLTDNDPHHVVLQNNGMAAIKQALEVAVEQTGLNNPKIAYAGELYGKTTESIYRYAKRHRLTFVDFDSSSNSDIDYVLEREKPDIIISETVGNGPNVPVLDHDYLLEQARSAKNKPVVILDHTLPLTSGYDIFSDITEDDRVIVVESGTKAYSLNAELAGITFVKNPDFLKSVRELRCQDGTLPGVASTEKICQLLPKTKAEFDERNKAIYRTTAALAVQLYIAQQNESGADFVVRHPALDNHQNSGQAMIPAKGLITPVFYIQSLDVDQDTLARRFQDKHGIADHAQFGQSFGFDETRILPEKRGPYVRIAGGAQTDVKALGALMTEAILKK